jgi:hypothetical protein
MIPQITRTGFSSTDRWKATVRQSEINIGSDPWPDALDVDDWRQSRQLYYLVRFSTEHAVYQAITGETITVLEGD